MSLTASLSMWFAVDCYMDQYHDPHNTYYQLKLYSLQDCCDECKIHKQITFSNCLPRTTDPKDDRVRFGHGNDFILNIQKTLEQTVQKQVKQTQIFVSQMLYLWAFLGRALLCLLQIFSSVCVNLVFIASVVKRCNVMWFNFAILGVGSKLTSVQKRKINKNLLNSGRLNMKRKM